VHVTEKLYAEFETYVTFQSWVIWSNCTVHTWCSYVWSLF